MGPAGGEAVVSSRLVERERERREVSGLSQSLVLKHEHFRRLVDGTALESHSEFPGQRFRVFKVAFGAVWTLGDAKAGRWLAG